MLGYNENEKGAQILTGINFESVFNISNEEITKLLEYFQDKDRFILGNQVESIKPNGLGDYFKFTFGFSPKYASHIATYLVDKKAEI